mmetsp:Transcript_59017/g.144395  ORF Transcript_59017/g.144395 Transcript_59017/m.144395 type:complete len:453 (-) Transcript_59017:608-1966(-)
MTTNRGLVQLLLIITIVAVGINVVFLMIPLHDIPVHENHYFFSNQGHRYTAAAAGTKNKDVKRVRKRTVTAEGRRKGTTTAAEDDHPPTSQPPPPRQQQDPLTSSSSSSAVVSFPDLSDEEGEQYILGIFKEANVELTPEMKDELPSWSQVKEVVGPHPYILGLDRCEGFRRNVPPIERMLGSSGMFNTGTNLITHLLKQNCEIPERREQYGPHQSKESYGMRWQVPWGKHTPVKFRLEHATQKASAINKEWILPVVTVRHPYTWFKSMCKNSYSAKWSHRGKKGGTDGCPNIRANTKGDIRYNRDQGRDDVQIGDYNPVVVKYADERTDNHENIAALWNDWYGYYLKEDIPYVMIRMEDMVFYPKETTKAVCECAGGEIRKDKDAFTFIVDSAKADSPGHDKSTGIFAAWVKYSKRFEPMFGFSQQDYDDAKSILNQDLMSSLGYHHPPPS